MDINSAYQIDLDWIEIDHTPENVSCSQYPQPIFTDELIDPNDEFETHEDRLFEETDVAKIQLTWKDVTIKSIPKKRWCKKIDPNVAETVILSKFQPNISITVSSEHFSFV